MRKLLSFLLFSTLLLVGWNVCFAGLVPNGMHYTVVQTTSASIFTRGGTLYKVVISTGYNADGVYAMLVDTGATVGLPAPAVFTSIFTSSQIVVAPFGFYPATMTTTMPAGYVIDFSPNGVRVINGLAVIGTNSGNRVGVYWSKGD